MPLHMPEHPNLSMARLLLSEHPYVLQSSVRVCRTSPSGKITMFSVPIVEFDSGAESPVRLPCTLMTCQNEDLSDARPLAQTSPPAVSGKRVNFDESKNEYRYYSPGEAVRFRNTDPAKPASPTKSILRISISGTTSVQDTERYYQACLFATTQKYKPQLGECPAAAFTTVTITARSHNSLNLLPEEGLSLAQLLLLKHVTLQRLGLENALRDFQVLYDPQLVQAAPEQIQHFEALLELMKSRLEDAVFCLNSVARAVFPKPVASTAKRQLLTAMEKYFLMFQPADKTNAINFGASIVTLLCGGQPLCRVLRYMARYMTVETQVPEDNLIKTYALLTI